MTAFQREQLRLSLLRYLDLNPARWGLSTALLWQCVLSEGSKATADEIDQELAYLADPSKGLIVRVVKMISPENPSWNITAAGRDYLASK